MTEGAGGEEGEGVAGQLEGEQPLAGEDWQGGQLVPSQVQVGQGPHQVTLHVLVVVVVWGWWLGGGGGGVVVVMWLLWW